MCLGSSWSHIFVIGQFQRIDEHGDACHAIVIKNEDLGLGSQRACDINFERSFDNFIGNK